MPQQDKWAQFEVKQDDRWAKYQASETAPGPSADDFNARDATPGQMAIHRMDVARENYLPGIANIPKGIASVLGLIAPPTTGQLMTKGPSGIAQERIAKAKEMLDAATMPARTAIKGALSGRKISLPGLPGNIQMPEFAEGDPANPVWDQAVAGASQNLSATVAPAAVGAVSARVLPAAKAALLKKAPTVYQKALQPSPSAYSAAEIEALKQTGLKEGIPVSQTGLNKLDSLVNDLNTAIEADIASNPNAPISPSAVAKRLAPTRAKAAIQTNPEADVAQIDAAKAEFLRQHQTTGQQPRFILDREGNVTKTPALPPKDVTIPAEQAQAIKKGTYQQLNKKAYGEMGTASTEAQKALARGLKEELETHFPEIKAKNAREGKLFDLRPELEKAINRAGNKPYTIAKALNILRDPAVTSRIAIMMYKAGVPPATAQARIAAFTTGLAAAPKQSTQQ